MLSASRAERLARRAGWRPVGGNRGVLARRAGQRLAAAGDHGDQNAIEAVWQAWLRHPDDEGWELLARWREREILAGALLTAATAPERAAQERAELAAFCARHGLVPADPVRRTVFFLLTGQEKSYRAADPDGSLLAAGYASAREDERARLRLAMASAGDLDLVRVVARERPAAVTADEVGYLTAQLAARRDWPGLWRLVRDLRVTDAVHYMRLFGSGWRPAGESDGTLFGALARADRRQLARARHALKTHAESGSVTIPAPGRGLRPEWGALSADGRRLAVIVRGDQGDPGLSVFDVPAPADISAHTRPETYRISGRSWDVRLAFAGDTPIVGSRRLRIESPSTLARHTRDRTEALAALYRMRPEDLAPSPGGGIVVLTSARLRFCDHGGTLIKTMRLPQLEWLHGVTAGPAGRLGVAGPDSFAVVDATDPRRPGLVASAPAGRWPEIAFCSPDRILTVADADYENKECGLGLWRLDGDRLELVTSRRMPLLMNLAVIPWHGTLASCYAGRVRYLDELSLADAPAPAGFATDDVSALWNSADLGSVALARDDGIDVHTAVPAWAEVADRTPAEWTPADLRTVAAALAATRPGSVTRPLLDLLRTCLEHRFGLDVSIGNAVTMAYEPEDIALASGEQPC